LRVELYVSVKGVAVKNCCDVFSSFLPSFEKVFSASLSINRKRALPSDENSINKSADIFTANKNLKFTYWVAYHLSKHLTLKIQPNDAGH
jgi:hypothetical protein